MRWLLTVYEYSGKTRKYELDHEYDLEEEAMREATRLADNVFTGGDDDWTLMNIVGANETTNTYRVPWSQDLEAESPEEAAMSFFKWVLALRSRTVGDNDRPILEVRQFRDTDKPPLCVKVDTLDFQTIGEEWYDIGRVR